MTDTPCPQPPLAAFRGRVICRHADHALTLSGPAADAQDERLLLTFIGPKAVDVPGLLTDPTVLALDPHHYRILAAARSWEFEAASAHLHRDVGESFYRAIPPRPVPLKQRLFWRLVLTLVRTRSGKRLLRLVRNR